MRCFGVAQDALSAASDLTFLSSSGSLTYAPKEPPITYAIDARGALRCFGCATSTKDRLEKLGPLRAVRAYAGKVLALDAAGTLWQDERGETTRVPKAERVTSFAAGAHACAVLEGGRVLCWGYASYRATGFPSATTTAAPGIVPGLEDATAVAAGYSHTCVLHGGGRVRCFGENRDGQLGGEKTDANGHVDVPDIDDATEISASGSLTCVARRSGKVACWGEPRVLGPSGGIVDPGWSDAELVDVGHDRVCAARRGGAVDCFGDMRPIAPQAVAGLGPATRVAAAAFQSCALVGQGELWCWGRWEVEGKSAEAEVVRTPRLVHEVRDAVHLSMAKGVARLHDGCVVRRGGTVLCWYGPAKSEPGITDATEVAVGQHHACALRSAGRVSCWGSNAEGQLARPNAERPSGVVDIPEIAGAVEIDASGFSTCARMSGGAVRCWGGTTFSFSGERPPKRPHEVVTLPGLSDATSLAIGYTHGCAGRAGGRVACFGSNLSSEVTKTRIWYIPKPVTRPDRDVSHVAAGGNRTCALSARGELSCWGYRFAPLDVPFDPAQQKRVAAAPALVQLSIADYHMCARDRDGAVTCWGADDQGQLGAGGRGPLAIRTVLELTGAGAQPQLGDVSSSPVMR